jgi:tetratricopeptide (TPR) repeat protein
MEALKHKIAELMKADKYADAFIYCGKALRENPHDEVVQKKAAFIFQRINDAHIEIEATTAEEYTLRGIAHFYANQIESAMYDFNMAIETDDTFDYAWKSRSFLHFVSGQFDQAERDIRRALDINTTGEYYNDLGNIKSQQDNSNPESLDYYLKATELNPEVEQFWYNYGSDLAEKGKLFDAIEALNKAIELSPNYEDAIVNREHIIEFLNSRK